MMKQVATVFALVGSAAAFAPAQQQQFTSSSSSSALEASKPFANELGAQAPVSTVQCNTTVVVFHSCPLLRVSLRSHRVALADNCLLLLFYDSYSSVCSILWD